MIESLNIQNFQKLDHSTVQLDPHLTVFVGKSGAGKSSTLRALRWLLTNRPTGSAFVRHGENKCQVSAVIDGNKVVRVRHGSRNIYSLDGKEFAAIGTGVPDEIASLVNISDINISRQHDAPFFFSLTPAQVSKELNKIIALDLIDSTLAALAAEVRESRTQVTAAESRLNTATQRRDSLAWVPDLSNRLVELEQQERELAQQAIKRTRIAEMVRTGRQATIALETAQGYVKALETAVVSYKAWLDDKNKVQWLRSRLKSYQEAQAAVDSCIPQDRWQQTKGAYQAWATARQDHNKLATLLQRHRQAQREADQSQQQAKGAEQRLQAALAGKKCPLCRQNLPVAMLS